MANVEMIMILGVSIMGLCVLCVVAMVIYSKSGGSTTAGSVTQDVTSGFGAGIIDIFKQIGTAFNADNQACKDKYGNTMQPEDNVFAEGVKCYACKAGHQKRTEFDVTTEKACYGPPDVWVSVRKNQGKIAINDRTGWDDGAQTLWACPYKTDRNTDSVKSPLPCQGTCSDLYGTESFQHGLSGECYSCPGGEKLVFPQGAGKECIAKDGTVFAWVKNGLMNVPVKLAEPLFESAVYLGTSEK